MGYRLEGLEVPVETPSGRVVIDVVAFGARRNRFLLGEGKSGGNVEQQQAQRYGLVDATDLVRLIGVTLAMPGELAADPIYLCLGDAIDRILIGLEEAGCRYPVLRVGTEAISLHGGPPADAALAAAFESPVPVDGPPPAIILVDSESDDAEYDSLVAAALVAEVAQGHEVIACPELARRAIPYLDLFAAGYRNGLIRAVSRAAQRLCEAAPESFEYRRPTQTRDYAVVKVIDSPEHLDPRGRTQRYQAIKARMTGRPVGQPSEAVQGALFDEVDLAAELDKADTGEPDNVEGGRESQ